MRTQFTLQGLVAQFIACPIADLGVVSSIPAWSHTFVEIVGQEIFSTVIIHLRLIQELQVLLSVNKLKYVHRVLVNRLKSVARLTDCLDMTIFIDGDVRQKAK